MSQTITKPVHTVREPSDLNDVQIFVATADAQTLTAASRHLRIPTSTISRAISRLEKHLRVTLAQRNARGFVLTDVGRGYLAACRRALCALDEGEDWIEAQRTHPNGVLKLAAPVTFAREILGPLMHLFLAQYPGLKIEIEVFPSGQHYSPPDNVDILFQVRRPGDSARRMKLYPGHAVGVFASAQYVEAHGQPAVPSELVKHLCIGRGRWRLTNGQTTETIEPAYVVDTFDPYMHLALVSTGVGIGILPLWLARRPDMREQLKPVLPGWSVDPLVMCALFFGPLNQSPKVQAMLDFLSNYIGTPKDPRIVGHWSAELFPTPGESTRS